MDYAMKPMPRKPRLLSYQAFLRGTAATVQVTTLMDAAKNETDTYPDEFLRNGKGYYEKSSSGSTRKRGWSLVDEIEDCTSSVPGRAQAFISDESSVSSFASQNCSQRSGKSPRRPQDHPSVRYHQQWRQDEESLQRRDLTFPSETVLQDTDKTLLPLLEDDDHSHCKGRRSVVHAPVVGGHTTCSCNILHMTCMYMSSDLAAIDTALKSCPPEASHVPLKLPQSEYSFPLHIVLSQYGQNHNHRHDSLSFKKKSFSSSTSSKLNLSSKSKEEEEKAKQLSVAKRLVKEAPNVLHQVDGPLGEKVTPLALALTLGLDTQLCRFLCQAHLPAATLHDGRKQRNFPLHLACQRLVNAHYYYYDNDDDEAGGEEEEDSSSLELILTLLQAYPAVVCQRNRKGQTPLDILVGHTDSPQCARAMEFLQRTTRNFAM